jgi:hypothetical protein
MCIIYEAMHGKQAVSGGDCPVIILRSRPNTSRRLDFSVRRKDVAAENGLLSVSKMQQIALPN